MNERVHRILAALLLLALLAAAGLYVRDLMDTWELAKSERSTTTELSAMRRGDVPVQVIDLKGVWQDRGRYLVVDVREKEEFSQGHVRGAIHHRLGELLQNPKALEQLQRELKGRIPVFYCHDGERSQLAAERFAEVADGPVYYVNRGYREIRAMADPHRVWEGHLRQLLPPGHEDHMRRWLRKRDVWVDTLVDLSMQGHRQVPGLEGKHFIHAPILLMSDRQIDELIQSLDDQPVVALCNSKVSCFSTRILRYRLEEHGMTLAGFVRLKDDVTALPGI
ncbi:MAG: rhodanese-like domain-containing protein [Gammaproteobacteria bacterium]|nr:MAG: rhodanese-like domain-containing protein [Gammaproteobacteria bacterium]